jgi:antitoxin (DNA-binding transcriptional repressor) of toxin-antitoxin stability system
MKTVSMLEFRRDAPRVIRRVLGGERLILTYRGRPAVSMAPVPRGGVAADDPFYALPRLATAGESLSNEAMDEAVYGR